MYLPTLQMHEPETPGDAASLRATLGDSARFLAGGTDLLVDLKTNRISADHLINLSNLPELQGLSTTDTGLTIGALTTITRLCISPLISGPYAAVGDAARLMAAPQIRNLATIGGNIASAVPCADLPPILIALDASVTLVSPHTQRIVSLSEFFLDARRTVMHSDELLTQITIPMPPTRSGAAYERFSHRNGNAIAVASVAASLTLADDDTISSARIALGAVAPIPTSADDAAQSLIGQPPNDTFIEHAARIAVKSAKPICDIRGSAEFRTDLVAVLCRRALTNAHARARGDST